MSQSVVRDKAIPNHYDIKMLNLMIEWGRRLKRILTLDHDLITQDVIEFATRYLEARENSVDGEFENANTFEGVIYENIRIDMDWLTAKSIIGEEEYFDADGLTVGNCPKCCKVNEMGFECADCNAKTVYFVTTFEPMFLGNVKWNPYFLAAMYSTGTEPEGTMKTKARRLVLPGSIDDVQTVLLKDFRPKVLIVSSKEYDDESTENKLAIGAFQNKIGRTINQWDGKPITGILAGAIYRIVMSREMKYAMQKSHIKPMNKTILVAQECVECPACEKTGKRKPAGKSDESKKKSKINVSEDE